MVESALKHLRHAFTALIIIICVGTGGYMVIEGWNVADSLYMVIITITHENSTRQKNSIAMRRK